MDSGNSSASIQSTSGDDEEYDSRAESSFSAFLNNSPSLTHVGPFSNSTITNLPNPLQPQHHHNNNTHMFDPLSNYLDPIQRRHTSFPNPNSLLNLDVMWSKPARSEPNPTDLGSLIPCSSSSTSPQNQAFVQTRGNSAVFLPTHNNNLASESGSRGLLSVSAANNDQANNTNNNMVRNPKKRSRASRRAPTTVLTTDTTNFRAMVQEFTGIPAPPFPSSSFPRSRFDLFGSASTSTMRSTHLDPPYLLRPFAHKLPHLHPFSPSSSMMDTLLVASNNSTNSTTNSTSIDHLGLLKQPQPLNFNMHNPLLNFQTPPKYPLDKSSVLVSKTQTSLEIPPSSDSFLKMGVFEELGLRHDRVNTNVSGLHQNMVSSPSVRVGSLSSGNNNLSNASTAWAHRTDTITNNDCDHGGGGAMMSLSGTDNYSNVTERDTNGGKVHYSASSSDFHGEKGPECTVAARSEGMVESWINCSSD